MAGLSYGDTSSWEIGQRLLAKSVPREEVGPLFGRFYGFARALLAAAQRPLSCQSISCSRNCVDEALTLHMIEMSQRANHSGTLSAAAMLGVDDLGTVLQAAQALASALTLCGLFVHSPSPVANEILSAFDRFLKDHPQMDGEPYGAAMAATLRRHAPGRGRLSASSKL